MRVSGSHGCRAAAWFNKRLKRIGTGLLCRTATAACAAAAMRQTRANSLAATFGRNGPAKICRIGVVPTKLPPAGRLPTLAAPGKCHLPTRLIANRIGETHRQALDPRPRWHSTGT